MSQPEVEQRAPDASAPAHRPPSRRAAATLPERLARHLVLYGVGLVALQLAFRAWALSGSWFYFDDIAFTSRALNQPLDVSYLMESYGGHLMPGGFLVVWLLTKVAVYSWWPWAAVLLGLQALAGLGMLRLLVSLFGRQPLVLALLAGYLSYVFTLSAGIWFAAGINQLPMQVALVFGLHAQVEYLRHRRLRSLTSAVIWTVAGLVFYEKTLLLLGVYAIVAFAWFATGTFTERLTHLWETYRPGVLAFGALGLGYLALYAEFGLDFSPGNAQTQPLSPIIYDMVGTTLLPGLVGGPLQWEPLSVGAFGDPSQAVVLVSWVAFAALLVHAQRTRTKSRRAWSLLAFTSACNVVLLASARANVVGPAIAREYRYQTESAALFVLGVGLAFLPLLGATEVNQLRPPAEPDSNSEPDSEPKSEHDASAAAPRDEQRVGQDNPRFVVAVTLAVVLAALLSSTRYVHLWQDRNPTKQYFANVDHALASADRKPVPLVDVGIPQTLLWSYRYPENAYSHVFRNHAAQTSYPRASLDQLYMFDDAGHLAPVAIPDTRVQLGGSGCGFPLEGRSTSIPLNGPVIGGGWWLRISYGSARDVPVHLDVGDEPYDLTLPKGLHNMFVQASGTFDHVVLSDYPRGTGLCVTALTLGLPAPAPTAS